MNPILSIKNLNVSYGNHKTLKDINLDINQNEITSIIGPSGCGKSTLLKCINNIIKENTEAIITGSINYKNININEYDIEDLRKEIGMVFQQSTPFPLSIYKNMEYPLKYYGVDKNTRKSIIERTLKLTGLDTELNNNLNKSALKLSGGQAQRLCIARAITINPTILLLDEPCSALDIINTKKIEDLLLSLKENYSIIIVTHNLAEAKRISDRTIFMFDGEIVEDNTTDVIFNNPSHSLTRDYISGNIG